MIDDRSYDDHILEYFILDSNQIPPILINLPPDLDPNMAIDDEGHTRCIDTGLVQCAASASSTFHPRQVQMSSR
jgi:hypothetical protein